jgi:hypothetical protein
MQIEFNSDQIISNVEPQINESGPTDSGTEFVFHIYEIFNS